MVVIYLSKMRKKRSMHLHRENILLYAYDIHKG